MRLLPRLTLTVCLLIAFSIKFTPMRVAHIMVTDCTNFIGAGTISQAVTDANSKGGTISVTCTGTIFFANQLRISATVIINNDSGGTVTFDEAGDDNRFFVVSYSKSLTLNGFTLQNGNAPGEIMSSGGAISNFSGATLTIINCTFTNNSARAGGAIENFGTVNISNSIFMNNSAQGVGGAISSTGTLDIGDGSSSAIMTNLGTLTISNSIFSGNLSNSTEHGSAIFSLGTPIISQDSHYENNTCMISGTITDKGGNTEFSAEGCPGMPPSH